MIILWLKQFSKFLYQQTFFFESKGKFSSLGTLIKFIWHFSRSDMLFFIFNPIYSIWYSIRFILSRVMNNSLPKSYDPPYIILDFNREYRFYRFYHMWYSNIFHHFIRNHSHVINNPMRNFILSISPYIWCHHFLQHADHHHRSGRCYSWFYWYFLIWKSITFTRCKCQKIFCSLLMTRIASLLMQFS